MSESPFHYFVLRELMISYFNEHFKDDSTHIQAVFIFMLYNILHTVSSNLSRALYRLIWIKKIPRCFPNEACDA